MSQGNEEGGKKEVFNMRFAPELTRRTLSALELKRKSREEGETWMWMRGDYGGSMFLDESFKVRKIETELTGMEQTLARQINATLLKKSQNHDQSPVVVLDFGGMYGMSMLRIAESMKELVEKGKVAFVVTNLAFTPEWGLANKERDEITDKEVAFIQRSRSLVHYITAYASEIEEHRIVIPGQTLSYPLKGTVDIIHEDAALWFGQKNDVDIPRLAALLSRYGIFFLGSKTLHPNLYPEKEKQILTKAHQLGKENLLKSGLAQVDFGERRTIYEVFVKPEAPLAFR